jgi:predicted Zn-dependent protease
MRTITSICLLFFCLVNYAQSTDEKLAAQFYENGEYEKAEGLYKQLHKQNRNSIYIYENYLNTLLALKEQKDAEKLVEKQIKENPSRLNNQVDLGYVYLQFDEKEKADRYFDKLIKENVSGRNTVLILAQSFERRMLSDRAIQTYEQGIKKQGVVAFHEQLLASYRNTNNTKDLTDLALEVIQADGNTFEYVTRVLDIVYEDETASTYLQQRTLLYAQKHPSNQIFDELLLEVFLQQKKYTAALRQVKSLDKRIRIRNRLG